MSRISISKIIILSLLMIPAVLSAESYTSKYKGEELREIKTLSANDISQLEKGGGWGFAKAAELNGYPGPLHILQMESEIALTPKQKTDIEALYQNMNLKAAALGKKFISLEKELNIAYAKNEIDAKSLGKYVTAIEAVRSDLRFVHLSAHLETPNILTEEQVVLYNKLRGYSSNDPCSNVPKGHNPKMWKMHHGCN